MIENIKQPTSPRLATLRQYHTINPGRELNTVISTKPSVDVLLDLSGSSRIHQRIEAAEEEWNEFLEAHKDGADLESEIAKRQLGEICLVKYAAEQLTGDVDRSEDIGLVQEQLFDYYSPELFQAAVRQKIKIIEALDLPYELETSRALLLDMLDAHSAKSDNGFSLEQPNKDTLIKISEWLKDQFGDLFDEIDGDDTNEYDANAIAEYFQKAIDSTPALRDNGWIAEVVHRDKSAISVYASDKKMYIPSQCTTTKQSLKNLLIHEIFGHALRSGIAEENGDAVGRQGTATYARFEESFMIALEQCLQEEYDLTRGIDHYIAIGLSVTEGLSKDDIAHIFSSIYMLQNAKNGVSERTVTQSQTLTKKQLGRTFAGMTDVDEGIAHRKDIDYLHGLNDSWELLNFIVEHDIVSEAMPWILSAKFNPFDSKERTHISKSTPMPAGLVEFFVKHEMRTVLQ